MYRREFLQRLALGAAAVGSGVSLPWVGKAAADQSPLKLSVTSRTIEINGKAGKVFGLGRPDGKPGLTLDAGSQFDVLLSNQSEEGTLIHWHGLTPPWEMDGVPDNPAPLLSAGEERRYTFPVGSGGTHWMHAHTLQEQNLLAAPLIVRTEEERRSDVQDVVVLLHDFSFRSPEELLADLKNGSGHGMDMGHGGMMGAMGGHDMQGAAMPGMGMDLNDIEYDAYLANDRTLDDPEVITVEKGGRVRLRVINGATATGFTVETGVLGANLVAVDGRPIRPVAGKRFPISMGQRLDILLELPSGNGAYPVLALREGSPKRTGIILATPGASIDKVASEGAEAGSVLDLELESRLQAVEPLRTREPTRAFNLLLSGNMSSYDWQIGGGEQLRARRDERIRLVMRNMSMMGHPMHLHGHHFQVVGINGVRFGGAVRDTVHVPPMAEVVIEFEASNPGRWPFHCHHLYHMASGMMSFVAYEGSS
ncbi:MAG TPA: copper oxidase [Rhizobium sp.]|nr:copper oxidase [Rhizobium sp.]